MSSSGGGLVKHVDEDVNDFDGDFGDDDGEDEQ